MGAAALREARSKPLRKAPSARWWQVNLTTPIVSPKDVTVRSVLSPKSLYGQVCTGMLKGREWLAHPVLSDG